MMLNTMYSGKNDNERRKANGFVDAFETHKKYDQSLNMTAVQRNTDADIDTEEGKFNLDMIMARPINTAGCEEPSLPLFPQNKIETGSLNFDNLPYMAQSEDWVEGKPAATRPPVNNNRNKMTSVQD